MDKISKIVELKIEEEDVIFDNLGLEVISFVENPAIEVNWKSFSKEQFVEKKPGEDKDEFINRCMSKLVGDEGYEQDQAYAICNTTWEENSLEVFAETYNDYPQAATENAKIALRYAEENGWGSCGTPVGKQRANQLANRENISEDTISRMASFERHRQNSQKELGDGCGRLMWLSWGGDEGIAWAQRKLKQIRGENLNTENDDVEMVEGIIDLLKQVEDPENRKRMVIKVLDDFRDDDVVFDLDSFLDRVEVELGIDTTSLKPYRKQRGKIKKKELSEEYELEDITLGEYIFTKEQQLAVIEYAEESGEVLTQDDLFISIHKGEFSLLQDILKGLSVIDALTTNQAADEVGERFYRYSGPPAERAFCRAMLRMNKVYKKDEIDEMERRGINRAQGHEGQPYSIFDWKGGVNCKHKWNKLLIFRGQNGNKVIVDEGPASGDAGLVNRDQPGRGHHPDWLAAHPNYRFMSEEKRIVIGPLLIPNKMIERKGDDGESYYVYFSKETIRKIAEKFFKEMKHNNTDINHDESITQKNTLLESWIVEDPIHDKSYNFGYRLPKGTWVGSYKVNDDETWAQIKEGKLKGFSVAGYFIEKNGKERQADTTLQKIIDMLNETEI